MGVLQTTRVEENEIARADDLQYGFQSVFDNFAKFSKSHTGITQNYLVGGKVEKGTVTTDSKWNLTVAPLIGLCSNTGTMVVNSESEILSVEAAGSSVRIDNVYVRGYIDEDGDGTDTVRAFKDGNTIVSKTIKVRQYLNCEFMVKKGAEGSVKAKLKSEDNASDFIKIAEIYIPGGAEDISECTIYPVTKDLEAETEKNTGWTEEVSDTIKIYSASELQNIFRAIHLSNGTLKAGVVNASNLNTGTTGNQISLNTFVLGANMYGKTATQKLADVFTQLSTDVNNINSTLKNKSDNTHAHSWTEITNKPSTFTPATHDHTAKQITQLTGYSKADSYSPLTTTDSLTTALGKIEKRLDNLNFFLDAATFYSSGKLTINVPDNLVLDGYNFIKGSNYFTTEIEFITDNSHPVELYFLQSGKYLFIPWGSKTVLYNTNKGTDTHFKRYVDSISDYLGPVYVQTTGVSQIYSWEK